MDLLYATLTFPTELIDIGWDAPAGQMYSSANDLSQLLKLIFRPEYPYDIDTEQASRAHTHTTLRKDASIKCNRVVQSNHPQEQCGKLGNSILSSVQGEGQMTTLSGLIDIGKAYRATFCVALPDTGWRDYSGVDATSLHLRGRDWFWSPLGTVATGGLHSQN